ncbi:hypothetical protein [Variovorax sp. KK3]|uniref:hypothetical protein n=1 Tax=Variovorax sp. KK3 TaxID=1855728 RepID=UPI00097C2880|nr:hypothetical protein [Variovorax sp. KK3]
MSSSIPTTSAARFSTAFSLMPNLVAWFLGAGASVASGTLTGEALIRYRENNLSKREIDTGDQIWIDRIDAFSTEAAYD